MKRRGWLATAGVLLALALGLALWRRVGATPAVATHTVGRGAFHNEVEALGFLRAVHSTPIAVPAEVQRPMRIAWLAAPGLVKKGDKVAVFDATEFEKEQADGASDRDVALARRRKVEADGTFGSAALSLERDVAEDELRRAEDVAPTDAAIFSRSQIVESAVDRTLLQQRAEAARGKQGPTRRLAATEAALVGIERDKAELRLQQADRALRALSVTAPHDGIVVMINRWQGNAVAVGDTVWPGQPIAELPDLSLLEAHVFVLEGDAAGLTQGQKATVRIEGQADLALVGTVTRVDVLAKARERQSPVKYFETVIAFDAPAAAAALKPGQRVRAAIVVDDRQGVLAVPRGALMQKEGKPVVYRLQGARFVAVEVTPGARSLGRVVIDKGLQEGDRVALQDPEPARSPAASASAAASFKPPGR